ncbi:MAG: hypothetical protein Q4C03_01450 [bacterium]|nr:hypothetical protein [bacterium]
MRRFGQEKKEYFEFQLEGSDVVYKIPLAASMPVSLLLSMRDGDAEGKGFEAQLEMLRKYMGNAVDTLTATMASDILRAWGEESSEQGASVGESQALSD